VVVFDVEVCVVEVWPLVERAVCVVVVVVSPSPPPCRSPEVVEVVGELAVDVPEFAVAVDGASVGCDRVVVGTGVA
jgi:hypothetical protein